MSNLTSELDQSRSSRDKFPGSRPTSEILSNRRTYVRSSQMGSRIMSRNGEYRRHDDKQRP